MSAAPPALIPAVFQQTNTLGIRAGGVASHWCGTGLRASSAQPHLTSLQVHRTVHLALVTI
jgi:hypothetical protein